jgi:hypothetical protein
MILAPVHLGIQYVTVGKEIYKFSIDGKFDLLYKKACLENYFSKVNDIYKNLAEGKDWAYSKYSVGGLLLS